MMRRRDLLLSLMAGTAGALLSPRRAIADDTRQAEAIARTKGLRFFVGVDHGEVSSSAITMLVAGHPVAAAQVFVIDDATWPPPDFEGYRMVFGRPRWGRPGGQTA